MSWHRERLDDVQLRAGSRKHHTNLVRLGLPTLCTSMPVALITARMVLVAGTSRHALRFHGSAYCRAQAAQQVEDRVYPSIRYAYAGKMWATLM